MGETPKNGEKRILVLCVDRDGDLGVKAQINTPIVGRNENLDAAVTLALHDPEETDANAMFEAIRTYDRLASERKPDEVFEIATLSGSERGGVNSDRKLAAEISQLLTSFPAKEVILVSDGYSDEAVLPLVESRVPVTSVRRVVVKHSESIEESAALFSRYLKTIVENPRYARIVIGLPGLLILLFAILSYFGQVQYFLLALVISVSAIMVGKGFGVDRAVRNFYRWSKEYSPPPMRVQISSFAAVGGIICIVLGVYLGSTNIAAHIGTVEAPSSVMGWLGLFPSMAGYFIKNAITLMVLGVCVALLGRAIRWYLERDPRLLRNAAFIASIAWSRQIFDGTADVLISPELGYDKLIGAIVVGILIGVASFLVIIVIHRSASGFFEETKEEVEESVEG
jgi:putative membrane protein